MAQTYPSVQRIKAESPSFTYPTMAQTYPLSARTAVAWLKRLQIQVLAKAPAAPYVPLGVAMLPSDARHAAYEALVPRRAAAALPEALRGTLQGQDAVLVLACGHGIQATQGW